jgi:hypothetical protein
MKHTTKTLVCEMYGDVPYEYYPIGQYIVAAPGVCGGRPTFKYTRLARIIHESQTRPWDSLHEVLQ